MMSWKSAIKITQKDAYITEGVFSTMIDSQLRYHKKLTKNKLELINEDSKINIDDNKKKYKKRKSIHQR